jgi:uncharacterized membrane protein YdfJ with MMPL/SSD domain
VILSFAAALGLSALAFRYVFGHAGESADFPLFVLVFPVALGIDYDLFLTTRIREEAARRGTRAGVVTGLAATGAVITSACPVLAGAFAALGTLPMVAFAEIGFAVALGVLLDTSIVRSVLVTSLFLDVGPTVWWPHRSAREDGGAAVRRAAGGGERQPVRRMSARYIASVPCRWGHSCTSGPSPRSGTPGSSGRASSSSVSGNCLMRSPTTARVSARCGEQVA